MPEPADAVGVVHAEANGQQIVLGIDAPFGHVAVAVDAALADRDSLGALFGDAVAERLEVEIHRLADQLGDVRAVRAKPAGRASPYEEAAEDNRPVSESGPAAKYDTDGVDLTSARNREVGYE